MQWPILSGIYTDTTPDWRSKYPRNLVPVPLSTGISNGYLKPADGIVQFAEGPGIDRGAVSWLGGYYRVMGTVLVSIDANGAVTQLGDVGGAGPVTMDYSVDRICIASGGKLWYWDGTSLTFVSDPDIGTVLDVIFIDGYFMTTDGTFLVVTELNDPYSVNPLKYGSAELDPDPVVGLMTLRNEVLAFNRYTIEVFQNVGGVGFPFQRIDGAQIMRGAIGTWAFTQFLESVAFLGSGRNESPAVWLAQGGSATKISTREIDIILQGYTEQQLAGVVLEAKVDKGHQHLWIRLPDQTLVYDGAATAALGEPVWFTLTSSIVGLGQYRAQNLVWVYNAWQVGDPTQPIVGRLVGNISSHYGAVNGWDFGTAIAYNVGKQAIVHNLELVALPGYVAQSQSTTLLQSVAPGTYPQYTIADISASVRPSTATYIDSAGLVATAAANVPRFTYNPVTLALLGLLVEAAATNEILYSEDFSNAAWVAVAAKVLTPDSTVAPDGQLTADTLTDNDNTQFLGITQSISVADDSAFRTFSIFVLKTSGGTSPTFGLNFQSVGGVNVGGNVRLNTDDGSYSTTGPTVNVYDANLYWRLCATFANNSTGNTTLASFIFPATSAHGGNVNTDDPAAMGSAIIWGAQWELGQVSSSYIPTASAPATRAADDITIATTTTATLDPTIWTSYSLDGNTWSLEKPINAGRRGDTAMRLAWRRQGFMRNWRIQRFRGTSDAHMPFARLEAEIEALN